MHLETLFAHLQESKRETSIAMKLMNQINSYEESDVSISDHDHYSDDGGMDCAQNDEMYANHAPSKALLDYKIISESQLLVEMNQMVKETATILQCSISVSKTILNHYKWNKDALLEKFLDSEDSQTFFSANDLINSEKKQALRITSRRRHQCEICFDTKTQIGLLHCGHQFCRDCWSAYIKEQILSKRCASIRCPELECNAMMDYDSVVTLAKSCELQAAFDKALFRYFVGCNKLLKWCPGKGCSNIIKLSSSILAPVTCKCGLTLCHQCSEQWHEPVDCVLLKSWLKKCSDDSETSNYIMANTKECPKCHGIIEKNGGCNHMTCKNLGCRNEFCWICLGPWAAHGNGYYSCNRFNDDESKKARDNQERSRAELTRYLHYFNRYANHELSLKLETRLYVGVEGRMDQMQRQGVTWIDSQYLRKAVDVLSECRRIMMFSYVFAYYLQRGSNNTKIFEDNQQDLELATEKLSHLLENDIESVNLTQLKQNVQDKCSYVDKRRIVLLKHCNEGYEKNQWSFVQDVLEKS